MSNLNLGYILRGNVFLALKKLSDADFRKTIEALFNYATNGIAPASGELSDIAQVIFDMEKSAIDSNNEKWMNKRKNS